MGRKNTAEAFEILLEIAEAERKKREAAAAPASGDPPPPPAHSAPGPRLHILERVDSPALGCPTILPLPTPPRPVSSVHSTVPLSAATRLKRDPLLKAPQAGFGSSRRTAPAGQPSATAAASPVVGDGRSAPPAAGEPLPPAPARPVDAPEAPAARVEAPPAEAGRRARRGPGRWLSRSEPEAPTREEKPRPAEGGFHAKVGSLGPSAGADADSEGVPPGDEFLSAEERLALAGGWGPARKPSIDPEILKSFVDGGRSRADSAGRAPDPGAAPLEIRLLEPREPPPSRLGLWDETPGRRSGESSPGAKLPGGGKSGSGPAKRSRSRRGAGSPRAPREEVAPPAPLDLPAGGGEEPVRGAPGEPADEMAAPGVTAVPAIGPAPASGEPAPLPDVGGAEDSPAAGVMAPRVDRPAAPAVATVPLSPRGAVVRLAGRLRGLLLAGRGGLLDRQVELKVSTIAAVALAGSILIILVLTYLRLPPKEDAMLASFLPESAPGKEAGPHAQGGAVPVPGHERDATADSLRALPLWSPSSAPPGEALAPAPPAARPDIRNIEVVGGELEKGPADPGAAEEAADGESPAPTQTVYMIQVRGKESMDGARKILDYLAVFGFEKSQVEPDPRGDKNGEGKALYTVFVGSFDDRADADRECSRLKRATRERPFRNRPDFRDFFEDAFVITRTRR